MIYDMTAKTRRKELIELIAAAADEIAEIDADFHKSTKSALARREDSRWRCK